jgi:hypothetical protein
MIAEPAGDGNLAERRKAAALAPMGWAREQLS